VRILVVEDGREYSEAFRALASSLLREDVELVRAGSLAQAEEVLSRGGVDAVFLDVVFDRTPPEDLIGPAEHRASLAERQGFYVAAAIARVLPSGVPVLLAYDFTDDPGRLAALRRTIPALEGVEEGESASRLVERLLGKA